MKHVLIVHGWGNVRPTDHWQRRLANALRRQGHNVHYPQLPSTHLPTFEAWSEVLATELAMIAQLAEEGEELVVVTHSLGCSTFLRMAVDGLVPTTVDRLLMVAPADTSLLAEVPSFVVEPTPLVRESLKSVARNVQLVGSDADPWTPRGIVETYAKPLEIEPVIILGAKHLASGDGWGPWQGVIDWVNDPTADLTVR